MDSQTKVNVEFKPAKRMKKRRELDALVNGKQGGGPPSSSSLAPAAFRSVGGRLPGSLRNGKHELLRNDSDSSEVEEFILPEKSLVRKRGSSSLCSICVTVCWGVLLVICLVGIGGLVGMCIQLKKDVDQLRIQLDKVGMLNNNIPGELRDIVTEQEKANTRMSQLESDDHGIEKLRENFTLLVKQVSDLEATAKTLSQSVESAPLLSLKSLQQQMKDLTRNVAELGSNLQTVGQNVGKLQEAKDQTQDRLSSIDARLQTLQLATNEQKNEEHRNDEQQVSLPDHVLSLRSLVRDVGLMNITFYTKYEDLRTKYSSQQASILELFNYTTLLNTRVTFLEVRPTPPSLSQNDVVAVVTASVQSMMDEMQNYSREQDTTIQQNKAQSDSVMTLLQAQIAGHESRISNLSERLNKVNVSTTGLENVVSLNIESLNSKLQLLEKELILTRSDEVRGKTLLPLDKFSSTSSSSSSSTFPSSSSTVTSSSSPASVVIMDGDQRMSSAETVGTNSSSIK